MLLRTAGEMRLGWARTNDPFGLMVAPILSIDDIDRMHQARSLQVRHAAR